jgi:hypothetical protein
LRGVLAVGALLLVVLAGCVPSRGRPANDPRYIAAVREYYNAQAAEDAAGCSTPTLILFHALQVVDSFPQTSTLRMFARYDYEQRQEGTGALICAGTGERFFTVFKAEAGPKVRGMSGRKRPAT